MTGVVEWMLADLTDKYAQISIPIAFVRLYQGEERLGTLFANLHERLNKHFEAINGRARPNATHHYWAEDSREMLALIDEMNDALEVLRGADIEVSVFEDYRNALERCKPWLSPSGGSTVPEDFTPIKIIKYERVFTRPETTIKLQKHATPINLKLIGEGSYAQVFSFVDPDYGIKYVVKRARKGLDKRDLARFKKEFEVLAGLSFPYIVEVYNYDEILDQYKMEFCDTTLRAYIAKRNGQLSFAARKRIALQFLYGINFIHRRKLLHRDVSLQNILLKVFDGGAVLVKLSDFGLVKDRASDFTRTETDIRGTIRDPILVSFKDYNILNEIYSVGWILSYIFTGKEALSSGTDEVSRIVQKCAAYDLAERYADVLSVVADVEWLESTPRGTPA